MLREFHCVQDCSDCCIYRQYFPSVDYGKIGVLLLPVEKKEIENMAESIKLKITILPRLGIGFNKKLNGPHQVIAYQLWAKSMETIAHFLILTVRIARPTGVLTVRYTTPDHFHVVHIPS